MLFLRPRASNKAFRYVALLLATGSLLFSSGLFSARPFSGTVPAPDDPQFSFTKHIIDAKTTAESCAVADVNQDGRLDVISGEIWYEAPGWKKHRFRKIPVLHNYVDDMGALAVDVNADGYPDVVSGSWFQKFIVWYENPKNRDALWKPHLIEKGFNIEIISRVNLFGGGEGVQILPNYGGTEQVAWFELVRGATGPEWSRHLASKTGNAHGIGVGDVNGDGRVDILTPKGWLEAPENRDEPTWKFHSVWRLGGQFGETGQISAYDVSGDGKNDIIASAGHSYGVFWYEQRVDQDGFIGWVPHIIDNSWSQAHALTLADLDGDGLQDIVTGKRYRAHDTDPGTFEPVGIYVYRLERRGENVRWVKHTLSYDDGVGTGLQIVVEDLNQDGRPDIVLPGKSGLHWMEQAR